jgi:predicted nucleic acid-binding protein
MRIPAVAIDTSVFVAAGFRPDSDSGRVIAAVRSGALRLAWSDETRGETRTLLERIPPLSWSAASDLFLEEHRLADAESTEAFLAVEDPDDRRFAALATLAGATLVSLDRHLLNADLGGRCIVRRPSEFLRDLAMGVASDIGKEFG